MAEIIESSETALARFRRVTGGLAGPGASYGACRARIEGAYAGRFALFSFCSHSTLHRRHRAAGTALPERHATLAHVLAVQGALRATLEALIRAGGLDRADAAALLERRAREMRGMTSAAEWHRAADTLEVWAREVREQGSFAK